MRRCWTLCPIIVALAGAAPLPIAPVLHHLAASQDVGSLTDPEFDGFASCIERGNARCIAAVDPLRPSGNAERGETVVVALSRALRTDPAAVLRLRHIPDGHRLQQLCADNDIEPTPGQAAAFRRDAIRALRKVRDPQLGSRRDTCIKALADTSR